MKYYSLNRILKENALYNVIFGERSNGKTYAVLEYAIKKYFEDGSELAIIRRMQDDFKGKRGATMFNALVENGVISKYSKGKYDTIVYYAGRWYFAKYDEFHKAEREDEPFAYAFAITAMEHDKSTAYPKVRTILFDEFLTRSYYLPNEFVLFMNVLSTIIRQRNDVKIFMLGNTVNKFCPYFEEMGLKHILQMKKGSIELYTYGSSNLTVAVEYAESQILGKKSDSYFAFDNPKLKMITGGEWEIDLYPHLPIKYKPKQILFQYFIIFNNEILHAEIIEAEHGTFTYIHRKTSPIKEDTTDLIFTTKELSYMHNVRHNISKPYDKLGQKIYSFFQREKVFYQSNEVGEIVRNYLMNCQSLIKGV